MLDGDVIGEARGGDDLIEVLRRRKEQLDITDQLLEELAGMTPGSVSKDLAPVPTKGLTSGMLPLLLGALGLKLIVAVDLDTTRHMSLRWQKRTGRVPDAKITREAIKHAKPVVLSELARAGANARWANVTPKERRAHADLMNLGREIKRLAGKEEAA